MSSKGENAKKESPEKKSPLPGLENLRIATAKTTTSDGVLGISTGVKAVGTDTKNLTRDSKKEEEEGEGEEEDEDDILVTNPLLRTPLIDTPLINGTPSGSPYAKYWKVVDEPRSGKRIVSDPLQNTQVITDAQAIVQAIQRLNLNEDVLSNPKTIVRLPFPYVGDSIPTARFNVGTDGQFTFMGRILLRSLLLNFRNFKSTRKSFSMYLHGSIGYGKSHVLAAMTCHLSKSERVVYIPDARDLAKEEYQYLLPSFHFAFTGDTDRTKELLKVNSWKSLLDFVRNLKSHNIKPVYIADQMNALDVEESGSDRITTAQKEHITQCLSLIFAGHYVIWSSSANMKTEKAMELRQSNEERIKVFGGLDDDEMECWWDYQQNLGLLPYYLCKIDGALSERTIYLRKGIEAFLGRVPLLLSAISSLKEVEFGTSEFLQDNVWLPEGDPTSSASVIAEGVAPQNLDSHRGRTKFDRSTISSVAKSRHPNRSVQNVAYSKSRSRSPEKVMASKPDFSSYQQILAHSQRPGSPVKQMQAPLLASSPIPASLSSQPNPVSGDSDIMDVDSPKTVEDAPHHQEQAYDYAQALAAGPSSASSQPMELVKPKSVEPPKRFPSLAILKHLLSRGPIMAKIKSNVCSSFVKLQDNLQTAEIKWNRFVKTIYACIAGVEVENFNSEVIDYKYFAIDPATWKGDCICGFIKEVMAQQLRISEGSNTGMPISKFFSALRMMKGNPSVAGFLVEAICLTTISNNGLNLNNKQIIPNCTRALTTDELEIDPLKEKVSVLFVPTAFNFPGIDALIVETTRVGTKKSAWLIPIQITLTSKHSDSEAKFFEIWGNWKSGLEDSGFEVNVSFLWIYSGDNKSEKVEARKGKELRSLTNIGARPPYQRIFMGFETLSTRLGNALQQ